MNPIALPESFLAMQDLVQIHAGEPRTLEEVLAVGERYGLVILSQTRR